MRIPWKPFEIGYAPDAWEAALDALSLRKGYTAEEELVEAGLVYS
jgi:hypothetical protein